MPTSHRRLLVAGCLLTIISILTADRASADPPAARSIFDGKTLDGWEGNRDCWRVEEGAITGEIRERDTLRRNEFLFWKDEVHDFELTAEFRIGGGPTANSGIQFRSQRKEDGGAEGYQADLDAGATWLGRIYDEEGRALLVERGTRVSIAPDGRKWVDKFAEPDRFKTLPQPAGQWNTYRITATASHVEVRINGRLCAVLDDHQANAADLSGRLGFQLHSGRGPSKIQFRNVPLADLGRTAPPTAAATVPPATRPAGPDARLAARQTESPVLWHLRPNVAPPSGVANPQAHQLVAGMLLTSGFQAELVAAEPDVHQPIAFAIDERGRLWVAEAFSYPNKQPEGKGKDRITILADTDGDGSFETRKTFAEGLNLVSALEVGFGGVWIAAAPQLLFIPDRNRDDLPDGPPEILLDGWGYQDTHETLNSFTWGPDDWLYGNQGVFTKSLIGKPGTPEAQRVSLNAGVWRYHPTRHEFEIFAQGGSNQWGLDFNEMGQLFMTHCRSFNGGGGTTHVIRNGHFWNQTNAKYANFISSVGPPFAPELKNYLPASAKYDSGEGGAGKPGTGAVYGGHSHVGTMIYLGDSWPDIYRDRLFTINLHGHQINQQINVREGAGYETVHAGYDLLFVPDPGFVGVDLQYGPDGAVYVIDWSDRLHCHSPHDERWDRTNGRIYRVTWGPHRPVPVDLAARSDAELVALQTHKNAWFARTARRLLHERSATQKLDAAAVAALREQLARSSETSLALRALWTLHVTGNLDPAALAAVLKHPADFVRAWGVQLGTERRRDAAAAIGPLLALSASDPSPTVRMAIASALPMFPPEVRWQIGTSLAAHGEDAQDRFLPRMIWFGLAEAASQDPARALALAAKTPLSGLADSIRWFAAQSAAGRDEFVALLGTTPVAQAARDLRILAFGLDGEARVPAPKGSAQIVDRFASGSPAEAADVVRQLSALFGDQAVLAKTRALLADEKAPTADRRRAFDLLKRVGDTEAAALYVRLLEQDAFRSAVIPLLAGSDDPAASAGLLKRFASLSETDRHAALGTLTSRPTFALALLQAIDDKSFDRKHVSSLHLRQMRSLKHAEVDRRLDAIFGKTIETSAGARATIARLKYAFDEAPLWAYEASGGRQVYQRTCASCHPLGSEGNRLGPDLAGSWRNGVDYFLENIVDPNAVVGEGFRLNLITRKNGTVVSGVVEKETGTTLTVRTATETINIPRDQVEEIKVTEQSIMPSGILESLTQIEAIELLKFLTTRN